MLSRVLSKKGLPFQTWKLKIVNNTFDVEINEMIDGLEAFKQGLIILMNTENDKYEIYSREFGVSYILTDANNNKEFNYMANVVSKEIINNNKEWITSILSIKKRRGDDKILISLGVRGVHKILTINVPIL